ncbi:MAG: hypothetical protein IJJ82_05570 [Clostridia bacterium]|nr:hypothetical protein [Clostridia bacterium]
MYIDDVLEQYKDKKIKLFVDMDGVIADYEVGLARDYDKKRPLKSNIKKLKEISENPNIEMNILSVTRYDKGFEEKNIWLDKYAPFFQKKNRNIISRESNGFEKSSILKANFIKGIKRNKIIIIIDDDPLVLKRIHKENEDVVLLKDTALVK